MTKVASLLTAAALSFAVASPALAGWDRSQVVDPAFSRSYDRQLELAAERLGPQPAAAETGSAVSTNDWRSTNDHFWFGPEIDRAAGRIGSPHDN